MGKLLYIAIMSLFVYPGFYIVRKWIKDIIYNKNKK